MESYGNAWSEASVALILPSVGAARHGRCYSGHHARLHRGQRMKDLTARFAAVVFTIAATLLISILAVGEMAIFRRSKNERVR